MRLIFISASLFLSEPQWWAPVFIYLFIRLNVASLFLLYLYQGQLGELGPRGDVGEEGPQVAKIESKVTDDHANIELIVPILAP